MAHHKKPPQSQKMVTLRACQTRRGGLKSDDVENDVIKPIGANESPAPLVTGMATENS